MILRQGAALLLTLTLSLSLAGCFGGTTSEADTETGERGSENVGTEESLDISDDFSVDAGTSYIITDGGAQLNLRGTIANPNGVTIAESYWRVFDDGFQRIDASAVASDAANSYQITAERLLHGAVYVYQFVALDTQGRAAVDTVTMRVEAFELALSAALSSSTVAEGEAFSVSVQLNEPLHEDLTVPYELVAGTALVGEDVEACEPCEFIIAAGESSATLQLNAIDDALEEGEETFTVRFPGLEQYFDGEASVELAIIDAVDLRPTIHFIQHQMQVDEKAGTLRIPLAIDWPVIAESTALNAESNTVVALDRVQSDSVMHVQDSAVATRAVTAAVLPSKPYSATAFAGTASAGEDYEANATSSVVFEEDGTASLLLDIIDDVQSEAIETVIVTISENEVFQVGDSDTVTLDIQSDDIKHFASARDAYCTVEDHVDIRCWGDFAFGKTATPPMGEIKQLVGAADYFCAIHELNNDALLSCWGNVPGEGGAFSNVQAPEQILALNDRYCKLTGTDVSCSDMEGVPGDAIKMMGGHQAACFIRDNDESRVMCVGASPAFEDPSLLEQAEQMVTGDVTVDGVRQQITCVRTDIDVTCEGILLPAFTNPLDVAIVTATASQEDLICVLDAPETGNQLRCYDAQGNVANSGSQQFAALSTPYRLASDSASHLCAAYRDGVSCLRAFAANTDERTVAELLWLDAPAVTKVSAGSLNPNTFNNGFSLCGLQDSQLSCSNPGIINTYYPTAETAAISAIDLAAGRPAISRVDGSAADLSADGRLYARELDFSAPLSDDALFTKGQGFFCAALTTGIECIIEDEINVTTLPGDIVQGAIALTANMDEACALVDGDIYCWGSEPVIKGFDAVASPFIAIDSHEDSGCVVSQNNELHCWGLMGGSFSGLAIDVGDFVKLAVASTRACVLGTQAVQCWDLLGEYNSQINFLEATDIAVSDTFVCVVEHEKARCWGEYVPFPLIQVSSEQVPQ